MNLELKELLVEKPITLIYWEIHDKWDELVPLFQRETEIKTINNFEEVFTWLKFVEVKYLIIGAKDVNSLREKSKLFRPLDIEKRRKLFIILISPNVETLDTKGTFLLEANLLVNPKDLKEFDKVFNKAKAYWESLYRPYNLAYQKVHGVEYA